MAAGGRGSAVGPRPAGRQGAPPGLSPRRTDRLLPCLHSRRCEAVWKTPYVRWKNRPEEGEEAAYGHKASSQNVEQPPRVCAATPRLCVLVPATTLVVTSIKWG